MEGSKTAEPSQTVTPCKETLEAVFWILYGIAGVVILAGNLFTFLVFVTTKTSTTKLHEYFLS